MERFTGTVEELCAVDVSSIIEWVTAIPFEEWPQQHPVNGQLRPAMVKDLMWHGLASAVAPALDAVQVGGRVSNVLLTVVMPGQGIDEHVDYQPDHWLARIHVPLTTNEESQFIVGGEHHHMNVGSAYLVNTTVEHAVRNDGDTPRIHLMWDILSSA